MKGLFLINLLSVIISKAYSIDSYIDSSQCNSSVKKISELLSQVSNCFMENSGPKSVCSTCYLKYQLFVNESKFVNTSITSLNGENCLSAIGRMDRFKTVMFLINNMTITWNNSNCQFCFADVYNNQYLNTIKDFIDTHLKLLDCLRPFTASNVSLCDRVNLPYKNFTSNTTFACQKCYPHFKNLVAMYQDIRLENDGKVCGDVENLFTCSHVVIGQYFNCANSSPDFIDCWPLIVIVAATLLFYSCSTICHNKNQIAIYNQSRVIACFGPDINSMFGSSMNSHNGPIVTNLLPNSFHAYNGPASSSENSQANVPSIESTCLSLPAKRYHGNKLLSVQ